MADKPTVLLRPLRNNLGLKLLALLVAVVIWHVIRDAISFEVVIPDIRIEILPVDGMAILNQSVASVDVTFRGSQEDIRLLDARQIHCVLDLRGRPGTDSQEVAVLPEMIKGARGVRAVSVDPRRIHVTLDREVERRLPVLTRTAGQPLFGQVESVACDPSTATLRGPQAKVETTETLYTAPVDVDGRVESFTRRVAILPPDDNWAARIVPGDVLVRVTIAGKAGESEQKTLPVTALVPAGTPMVVTVSPPAVNVILGGQPAEGAEAGTGDLRAVVDCGDLQPPSTQALPVRVYGVRNGMTATARPATVEVTVRSP